MTTELLINPETGEILDDLPEGLDESGILALLAARRDDAKRQEDAWHTQRIAYDRVLLARLEPGAKAVYGDVRLSVRQNRGRLETDARKFSGLLLTREATRLTLIDTIAAAKGFDADAIPADAREAYDESTSRGESTNPWVETQVVLRRIVE